MEALSVPMVQHRRFLLVRPHTRPTELRLTRWGPHGGRPGRNCGALADASRTVPGVRARRRAGGRRCGGNPHSSNQASCARVESPKADGPCAIATSPLYTRIDHESQRELLDVGLVVARTGRSPTAGAAGCALMGRSCRPIRTLRCSSGSSGCSRTRRTTAVRGPSRRGRLRRSRW
jgi:hypothetical protein